MKYIICGLEHVGLRVAEALLRMGEEISVITINKNEPELFYIHDKITRYVEGDARNKEILHAAGIENADYILIFTSKEIKNIEISCKAKEIKPEIKTALLINNLNYAGIIRKGFETNHAFHIQSIVSSQIVSACINKNLLQTLKAGHKSFHFCMADCNGHPFLINKTVKEAEKIYNIKIAGLFDHSTNQLQLINEEYRIISGSLIYISNNDSCFRQEYSISEKKNFEEFVSPDKIEKHSKLKNFTLTPSLRKVLFMYSFLLLISIFIFKSALNLSFINAIYFVAATTATVGFGDFNLQFAPSWVKLYGVFFMMGGAALLAAIFSLLTSNLISKRLGEYAGIDNRKMKKHIIVAGIGTIGLEVVNSLLNKGIKTVVIEKNIDNKNIMPLRSKLPILIGDASEQKILLKAGIKKARAIAALSDNDLNNINIILKGVNLKNNIHTVARVFSKDLNHKAMSTFEIDNVLCASDIAVPYIISKLAYKDIAWAGYLGNTIFTLVTIPVTSKNPLFNLKKQEIFEQYQALPVIIKRNNKLYNYTVENALCENDDLYLLGDLVSIKKLITNTFSY
jgi:Trk K+ transport system NAD-binding subunit